MICTNDVLSTDVRTYEQRTYVHRTIDDLYYEHLYYEQRTYVHRVLYDTQRVWWVGGLCAYMYPVPVGTNRGVRSFVGRTVGRRAPCRAPRSPGVRHEPHMGKTPG